MQYQLTVYISMINKENYWSYALQELVIRDYPYKKEIITHYKEIIDTLLKNYPHYEEIITSGKSLDEINYNLDIALTENISNYLLPGKELIYCPQVEEKKSARPRSCMLTGAPIKKGSYYLSYKAFLYGEKEVYVTSPITMEIGTNFDIPRNLHEFEILCERIDHSYESNREEEYNIETSGFKIRKLPHKTHKTRKKVKNN